MIAREWWGGMNRWSTEDLGDGETILHDTVVIDMCHYTFVQIYRMSHPQSKSECVSVGS